MEDCEICGRNIGNEHYEEYGRCQECYNNYTYCINCGEHLKYYLVYNNCLDYKFCSLCFTNQQCNRYTQCEITCAKCSCCYECCDKICGKLKKDEIIRLIMYINLPDDIIGLIIEFL